MRTARNEESNTQFHNLLAELAQIHRRALT